MKDKTLEKTYTDAVSDFIAINIPIDVQAWAALIAQFCLDIREDEVNQLKAQIDGV